MLVLRVGITDDTTSKDLDRYFTNIWYHRQRVKLIFDTTQCSNLSLRKILTIKDVLDKHRENSRMYIDHSNIIVKNGFIRNMLRIALCIMKTERPVKISRV